MHAAQEQSETRLLSHQELLEAWPALDSEERRDGFMLLSRVDAQELLLRLDSVAQAELILSLPQGERRLWARLLPPDDAADALQQMRVEEREAVLALIDEPTRREVLALLAYAEDEAGGLMNPRFARLRPDMSVDEAFSYLRRQTRETVENVYYAYVLDGSQRLLGVASMRQLMQAPGARLIRDVMRTELVTADEELDQEAVSHLFAEHDLTVLPVVDKEGRMKGIVTIDDIVDVVEEEATEDIQKIGGQAALDAPYLDTGMRVMFNKRVVWLGVLFLGQTLTATVVGFFEDQIATAAVLVIFMPLILSSGGNAGSQAATLVVRALSLGEVTLGDWWRVIRVEVVVGLLLGTALALLGAVRIGLLHLFGLDRDYAEYAFHIAMTLGVSLIGVVVWGTTVGSMLPLILRRLGFDPASASTPFVATLCDVTGLVIYFSVAMLMLRGVLL